MYLNHGIDAIAQMIQYFDMIPVCWLARLHRIVPNIAVLTNVLCEMAHEVHFVEVEVGFCSQDLIGFPWRFSLWSVTTLGFGLKSCFCLLTRRRIPRAILCVVLPLVSRSLSWHNISWRYFLSCGKPLLNYPTCLSSARYKNDIGWLVPSRPMPGRIERLSWIALPGQMTDSWVQTPGLIRLSSENYASPSLAIDWPLEKASSVGYIQVKVACTSICRWIHSNDNVLWGSPPATP